MKMDPYSTHQALLVRAMAETDGPILEMGGGWYSTPLINAFAVAQRRHATTIETDQVVFNLLKPLATRQHKIVLLPGFEFSKVGKFLSRAGTSRRSYIDLQEQFFLSLPNTQYSVAFIDQAPGFLRVSAIQFFADRAKFIITHDTEVERYNFEPTLSTFKSRFDFRLHLPNSVIVSNFADCSIFENMAGAGDCGRS